MRFITLSLFATLLSAPAFAADLGTYRPGTPYSSTVAGGADVCDSHCAGDAQCRGWNFVKPNPRTSGVCEFLSSVSAPISSAISISGESGSAVSFSSRVSTGGTNTIRVGTQTTPRANTVRVGQSASGRNIVLQAAPQRIAPQRASTRAVENMSLTEQQNIYRKGQSGVPQRAAQPQFSQPQPRSPQLRAASPQAYAAPQRQMLRPILDGSAQQFSQQQARQRQAQPQIQPKLQAQPAPEQSARRRTGPRGQQGPNQALGQRQGSPVPQFQDPRAQAPRSNAQNFPQQQYQGQPFPTPQYQALRSPQQVAERGQSRPPVGQAIQTPQRSVRPQPSTPSQRLAQMTAKTRDQASAVQTTGPIALNPEQARKSLFGSLNDDLKSSDLPTTRAVPTRPVTEQPLGEVLAGGL